MTIPTEPKSNQRVPLEIAGSKGRRMRILLVEDHADTATVLVRLLHRLGYDVIHAGTVGDALRLAKKELQGAGIDLVMSDVGLPDRSGLDMMKELSVTHGLRGIAISGYGTEADLAKSAAAGFVRHLIKPVDVLALRTAVAAVLNGK